MSMRSSLLQGLAALALGCGGPAPAARLPDPSPDAAAPGPAAAARTSAAPAAQTAGAPSPCAPRAPRAPGAIKVAARSGSSIALVEDGGRRIVYVADEDNRAVHVLDAEGPTELSVTALPGRPAQLLPLADGRVLVTLRDRNRLLALEPGARPEDGLTTLCERPTYVEPWGLAASPDGRRVAVTAGWDHRLMLLDGQRLDLERAVDLPAEPRGVLIPDDGQAAYVAHLVGGAVSVVSLARPEDPPKRIFTRPEPRPRPVKKGAPPRPAAINKSQELAASQGYALAALSLGASDGRPWPARIFAPRASSDPMRFNGVATFPNVYGGGGGGPAVIGAFVAVLDPVAGTPLGGEVAPLREARPEDCIQPRGVAVHGDRLLLACLGIDALVELDARAADPTSAERHRFRVGAGPTGVAVDAARGRALVFSQWIPAITVVDLAEPARAETRVLRLAHPEQPALSPELARGRALFHVTRDVRMSIDGRACVSCHPDGRADGLTWATPDGPRQTISLAGRVAGSGPYGWFGDHPSVKNHLNVTVPRLGGHGFHSPEDQKDLDALIAYVAALPVPSREGALVDEGTAALRARGRDLFLSEETGCASCHLGDAGDGRRHDVGSGDPREKRASFDTPALRLVAGSAPYFHDGRYLTLLDMLADPRSKMGRSSHLSERDRRALAAYLESL